MTKKKTTAKKAEEKKVVETPVTETPTVEQAPEVVIEETEVEEPVIENTETVEEVVEKEKVKGKRVYVKDWRELVEVEGVNQTATGKEYYGVKRKD